MHALAEGGYLALGRKGKKKHIFFYVGHSIHAGMR
jgi:hypothetical protein